MDEKAFQYAISKAAAIISKINNSLPLFPRGRPIQNIWSKNWLGSWNGPSGWRAKFDLDSYIPTLDAKAELISECEAIERNELINKERKVDNNNNNKSHKKSSENSRAAQNFVATCGAVIFAASVARTPCTPLKSAGF